MIFFRKLPSLLVLAGLVALAMEISWATPAHTASQTLDPFSPTSNAAASSFTYLPVIMWSPSPGTMVLIPASTFQMGCDPSHNGDNDCASNSDELPLHSLYLDAYRIDMYEVTNGQYAQCVATGKCTPPAQQSSGGRTSYYGNLDYDNYPVLWVSWNQANAYCACFGKRLPSEAEWEKAARGILDTRAFPWGDTSPTCQLANFYNRAIDQYCEGDTSAVGAYPAGASPYGVMDVAGNAWEWVNDWYDASYYSSSPALNPTGPTSGDYKVVRGGSWWYRDVDNLRVARRGTDHPTTTTPTIGFRCAASP